MFAWVNKMFGKTRSSVIKKPESWAEFFDEIEKKREFTPDLPELERKHWHWLFVPDELQTDHWQNILLKDCQKSEYVGFTQDHLTMLKHDLGIFSTPLIFSGDLGYQNPPKRLPIKGELYRVPPAAFVAIDNHKQNTVSCFRREVPIVLPYKALWAKDKAAFNEFMPKKFGRRTTNGAGKEVIRDGGTLQTNTLPVLGVFRVYAWMYFSDYSYWGDFLNLAVNTPPVRTWQIEKGSLIKEYYRFTNAEYGPPDKKPDPDIPF